MFGRSTRMKIKDIIECSNKEEDEEIRDRDTVNKFKRKFFTDKKRRATNYELEVGDTAIAKNMKRRGKLSLDYNPEKFEVVPIAEMKYRTLWNYQMNNNLKVQSLLLELGNQRYQS